MKNKQKKIVRTPLTKDIKEELNSKPLGDAYIITNCGLTEDGYQKIVFLDYYNNECLLQQSSIAHFTKPGASAIWLGGKGNDMHLSLTQVKSLIIHLQNWVDTGNINFPGTEIK